MKALTARTAAVFILLRIMAKIIIEVDDEYIREKTSPEANKEKFNPNASGGEVMKAMFDMIAFTALERRIESGETEFLVTRDMMPDGNRREYWDRNIGDILMLAFMAEKEEKKEQQP